MRPFFCFYGGKWRAALKYPAPKYNTIIEPFAGSAGYSVRYPEKRVILCDIDPKIAGIWEWLISATKDDISNLPDNVGNDFNTDEMDAPDPVKHLIGFWLNKGTSQPSKSPSAWFRSGIRSGSFWGPEIKQQLKSQVDLISHWEIRNCSYDSLPNIEATWFIDPPYNVNVNRVARLKD